MNSCRECGPCEIETQDELAGNSTRAPSIFFDAVIAAARFADDRARFAADRRAESDSAIFEVARAEDSGDAAWVNSARRRRSEAMPEARRAADFAAGATAAWRVLLSGAK